MGKPKQNKTTEKIDRVGMSLSVIYTVVLVFGIIVAGKLAYIQWFWKPDKDVERFFLPTSKKSVIEPDRGAILGYDGKVLAVSAPIYRICMDCTVLKEEFKKEKKADSLENDWLSRAKMFCEVLAEETGENAGDYYRKIVSGRKNGERYVKLAEDIDRGVVLRLEKQPLMKGGKYKSGVIVERRDSRRYPYGSLARRTIGYVKDNSNSNGNNHIGLEGKYNYVLHGKEGEIWLKPTDNKEMIRNYDSTYVKPEDGLDVRTTLDITLQDIMDKAIRKQMTADPKIAEACGVMMDVKTGAIRAMVNLTKDQKDSSLNESYNMAIGFGAEPGSVFKATTLMTALEDGCIKSLDDVIPKNDGRITGFRYNYTYDQDDHIKGEGEVSVLHGFEVSSNYVFRYLAIKNYEDNPKRFLDKLYMYKLGQAFDFDLEGLRSPYLPSPDSKMWSPSDLGAAAIGYAIKETPLHILTFYNAIANKGRMMKPYLVESIEKNGVVKTKKGPSVLNASICSKATADTLLRAMKAVTSEGTAWRLRGAKLEAAGKTGTSRQVLTKEEIEKYGKKDSYYTKDGYYHNLATFVGFFPADNPKYSAIICMNSSLIRGSLFGGVAPAAAMREIIDAVYAIEPEWGAELSASGKVPEMRFDRKAAERTGAKTAPVPDITGLGLKDAVFLIENAGLRCSYSGTGHVSSQNPKAGTRVADGSTITFTLR